MGWCWMSKTTTKSVIGFPGSCCLQRHLLPCLETCLRNDAVEASLRYNPDLVETLLGQLLLRLQIDYLLHPPSSERIENTLFAWSFLRARLTCMQGEERQSHVGSRTSAASASAVI